MKCFSIWLNSGTSCRGLLLPVWLSYESKKEYKFLRYFLTHSLIQYTHTVLHCLTIHNTARAEAIARMTVDAINRDPAFSGGCAVVTCLSCTCDAPPKFKFLEGSSCCSWSSVVASFCCCRWLRGALILGSVHLRLKTLPGKEESGVKIVRKPLVVTAFISSATYPIMTVVGVLLA